MPCWEVNTMSVQFSAKHLDVLKRAVDALGWYLYEGQFGDVITVQTDRGQNIIINKAAGEATIAVDTQSALNQLKVAYSQQALKKAAKAKGWAYNATTAQKGHLTR
jgi:frataxin-like iron-binding protein CyaY